MNSYLDTGFEPIPDQFWDPMGSYWSGIVPVDEESPTPSRAPTQTQTRSYEEPWYVDTINRAIERAAQVATIEAGGYPPYPTSPGPTPLPSPGGHPQREGIQLSQTTLMLVVGGVLLFMLGRRR